MDFWRVWETIGRLFCKGRETLDFSLWWKRIKRWCFVRHIQNNHDCQNGDALQKAPSITLSILLRLPHKSTTKWLNQETNTAKHSYGSVTTAPKIYSNTKPPSSGDLKTNPCLLDILFLAPPGRLGEEYNTNGLYVLFTNFPLRLPSTISRRNGKLAVFIFTLTVWNNVLMG